MTEDELSAQIGFLQANGFAQRAMIASLVDVLLHKGVLDASEWGNVRDGALRKVEEIEQHATSSDKWILDSAKSQILGTFGRARDEDLS